MKQTNDTQPFTIEDLRDAFYAGWTDIGAGPCETKEAAWKRYKALSRGAEPYWMQDVRIAQRKIDAARRARAKAAESE